MLFHSNILIHNKIHLISLGWSRPSIAEQCRIVTLKKHHSFHSNIPDVTVLTRCIYDLNISYFRNGASILQWERAGLLLNRSTDRSCTMGMIHNNIHLVSLGWPIIVLKVLNA